MTPLKVDLHIHTKEDEKDRIRYSAYDLIDAAYSRNFDALAITNHDVLTYSPELKSYAADRGIVLIPGVEACIEGKHVLLINMPYEEGCFHSLREVFEQKAANNLVIAPHPYFPGSTSLHGELEANAHLFDAVEYCHFYNHFVNFNKKAVRFAHNHHLPIVGNSDAHVLEQFGLTYSLILAEKDCNAIIEAIKDGRVKLVSRPLSLAQLLVIFIRVFSTRRFTWKKSVQFIRTGAGFIRRVIQRPSSCATIP
ncbi:MAG: PHP domain-containing protein [Deltaproteobacteria bacterium]|nr:PHP domain-containing protein [Deltaproteobacteria bacterium]MBW2074206.1 PHP domain-containing protein [Deltaproteobacteria bacterium]